MDKNKSTVTVASQHWSACTSLPSVRRPRAGRLHRVLLYSCVL